MPVQNPISIKPTNTAQISHRKMNEPIEIDFDVLLSGSIEAAAETEKGAFAENTSLADDVGGGTSVQAGIALPFFGPPVALRPELSGGSNPTFTITDGLLPQNQSGQSNPPIPGTAIVSTDLPVGLDVHQNQVPNIALPTQLRSIHLDGASQYSKTAAISKGEINRMVTGISDVVPTSVNDAKTNGSDHRLSALSTVVGDSTVFNPQISAESAITTAAGNTLFSNSIDTMASTSSLPTSVGLFNQRPDLNAAGGTSSMEFATIPSNISSDQWVEEASQTIHLLVKQSQQQAEIKVNPVELGPIDIQIAMVRGEASISFVAEHIETRNALEIALPRLKELLADSGISLTGAFVGSERQPPQQSDRTRFNDSISDSSTSGDSATAGRSIANVKLLSKSGVDVYA
jgi:Flagellar hook-length control protein FliK